MDTVFCKEMIISTISRRGNGTKLSPIRIITQVFEKDGTLIAEHDPSPETFTATDLIAFTKYCFSNGIATEKVNMNDVNSWLDSLE